MGKEIILYVFAVIFIIGYVTVLPLLQGVAKIKKNDAPKISRKNSQRDEDSGFALSSSAFDAGGYQPPSDNYLESKVTKKSRKLHLQEIHKEDLPINFVPNLGTDSQVKPVSRKQAIKVDEIEGMRNPDNYDYDLDELIGEENEADERERLREVQSQINYSNREKV